jgi:hypothetical protein
MPQTAARQNLEFGISLFGIFLKFYPKKVLNNKKNIT